MFRRNSPSSTATSLRVPDVTASGKAVPHAVALLGDVVAALLPVHPGAAVLALDELDRIGVRRIDHEIDLVHGPALGGLHEHVLAVAGSIADVMPPLEAALLLQVRLEGVLDTLPRRTRFAVAKIWLRIIEAIV